MTFGSFLDPKCYNPYYEDPRNPYMSRDSRIALHSPPAVGLATLRQRNLQVGSEQVGTLQAAKDNRTTSKEPHGLGFRV